MFKKYNITRFIAFENTTDFNSTSDLAVNEKLGMKPTHILTLTKVRCSQPTGKNVEEIAERS